MVTVGPVRNLQRWRDVQAILLRYGFDILIDREEIKDVRRILQDRLGLTLGEFSDRSLPERIRLMFEELGPTYVKLGQIMSSRNDLLPPAWIDEFSKLQDAVEPISYAQVRQVIQEELGAQPEDIYAYFDPTPIAAASIGQVHLARLDDRRMVVVKVQRPNIHPQIKADMEIMREIARIIETRTTWGKQYGIQGIINEFARSLFDELDYRNEGRNADRLRRNMIDFEGVHVPHIYWELVTARVLTMEEVRGIKINHLAALDNHHIDRPHLADRFIHSFCHQLFLDGFYHADPHPGNLFVIPETQELVYLDLGMMGQLLADQTAELTNLVLALEDRDTREIVRIAQTIGTPYQTVDEMALRRDIAIILNRELSQTLEELSFAGLASKILTLVFEHGIRLPNDLTLAVKGLVQAEEIARTLDPSIKIIDTAETVAHQLIWKRIAPARLMRTLRLELREFVRLARTLPKATETLFDQLEAGALRIGLDIPEFHGQIQHLYTIANRLTAGIILAGMVIGSAIAMGTSPHDSWPFVPVLGVIGFLGAMTIGGILVWDVFIDLWRTSRARRKKRQQDHLPPPR